MNRIEDYDQVKRRLVNWLKAYVKENRLMSLVVGVSGGIDSAVASTLSAETGLPTYVLGMPIHQKEEQEDLSDAHLDWLEQKYPNVTRLKYDLSETFKFVSVWMGIMITNLPLRTLDLVFAW